MVYGRGDHLIDHLSHTVQTLPVFATVGFREKPIRPIPIDDLIDTSWPRSTGGCRGRPVAVLGALALIVGAEPGFRPPWRRFSTSMPEWPVGAADGSVVVRLDIETVAPRQWHGRARLHRALGGADGGRVVDGSGDQEHD